MMSQCHRTWTRSGFAVTAAVLAPVLLVLIAPTDADAQQTRRVVISDLPLAEQMQIRSQAEWTGEEADRLLQKARTADRDGDYRQAAELFERSAQLRTPSSKRGVDGFEEAGRAYFTAEQPMRASRAWEEAASRALIRGDVVSASRNFMRAAGGAQRAGHPVRTSDMAWRAYYLTESPHLSRDQQAKLREHFDFEEITLRAPEAEPLLPPIRVTSVSAAETMRLRHVEDRYVAALRSAAVDTISSTLSAMERATLAEKIYFAHDESELSETAKTVLRNKARVFRDHPSMRFTITGYASTSGTESYNRSLGLRRAGAAREYLISQGVPETRINIASRGENELDVLGPGEVAGTANRRGEFWIFMADIPRSEGW